MYLLLPALVSTAWSAEPTLEVSLSCRGVTEFTVQTPAATDAEESDVSGRRHDWTVTVAPHETNADASGCVEVRRAGAEGDAPLVAACFSTADGIDLESRTRRGRWTLDLACRWAPDDAGADDGGPG
ncbi:MAG: hypothetical protein D6685_16010 [Bacteroidetes bacterium]|nr:MAG: hypothetical protein D6685_16010 [Bacteroidota bacterium]